MARQVIKKCRNCGSELPVGAVFCDMCGEPVARRKDAVSKSETENKRTDSRKQVKKKWRNANEERSRRRMNVIVGLIVAAMAITGAVVVITAVLNGQHVDKHSVTFDDQDDENKHITAPKAVEGGLPAMDSRVTAEQYEALKFGMTYDEVVALLGEEGGKPEYDYGNDRTWPGEFYGEGCFYEDDRPRIILEFSDDWRLIGMEEMNVIDGRTVRDNIVDRKTSRVEVDQKTVDSIKKGMGYGEIVETLGAEGILTNSESDRSGNDSKTYTWEYLGRDEYGEEEYDEIRITFNNGKAVMII